MDLHSAQNDHHHHHYEQQDEYATDERPSTTSEQSRGPSRAMSSGGHASASSGDTSRSHSHSRGGSVHSHRSLSPGSMMYPTKQPSSRAMYGRPGSDGGVMEFGVNTEEWGASDFFLDQGDNLPGQPIEEEATGENMAQRKSKLILYLPRPRITHPPLPHPGISHLLILHPRISHPLISHPRISSYPILVNTGMLGADNPSQATIDNDPTRSDRINIGVFWLQLISTGCFPILLYLP